MIVVRGETLQHQRSVLSQIGEHDNKDDNDSVLVPFVSSLVLSLGVLCLFHWNVAMAASCSPSSIGDIHNRVRSRVTVALAVDRTFSDTFGGL